MGQATNLPHQLRHALPLLRWLTPLQGYAAALLVSTGVATRYGLDLGAITLGAVLLLDAWRPPWRLVFPAKPTHVPKIPTPPPPPTP